MNITCKIDNEYTFNLMNWSATSFYSDPVLQLETVDLITVREIFKNFQQIDIYQDEILIASYTQFNDIKSIEFLPNLFDNERNGFFDVLRISLNTKNLAEKVEELDKKINKIVDIDSMSAEECKEYLTKLYSERGQLQIFHGCDVLLSDGTVESFTYNFEDQLNLHSALYTVLLVQDLTTLIPYHSHLHTCKMYTAADIVKIYMTLQSNSILIQTRVNMLNNWIRSLNNKEDILNVSYLSELPKEYQDQYDFVTETTGDLLFTIIEKFFPEQQEEVSDESEG